MAQDKDLIVRQRKYVELLCDKLGVSKSKLAHKAGLNHATLTGIFDSEVQHKLSSPSLVKLYNASGIPFVFDSSEVPLVGYSEGGNLIMLSKDKTRMIDGPIGAVESGTVAFEIRDNAMYPRYKQGDIAYYIKGHHFDPRYYGEDCVVELEDEKTIIRMVQKGATEGSYILEGYNAPLMLNIKVKSILPIIGTRRPLK